MSELPIVERLRLHADRSSDIARQMSQAKSLRQPGNEAGDKDLYMWPTPEQTIEGHAAVLIEELVEALEEARKTVAVAERIRPQPILMQMIDRVLAKVRQ